MKQLGLKNYLKLETKKDLSSLLLSLVRPLLKYKNGGNSGFVLSGRGTTYSPEIRQMEAFSRPLWGLVPFWMGGGRDKELEDFYLQGLINGTDKTSPFYWGKLSNSNQMFVEMAPIAFSLIAVPEIVWEPLKQKEKDNLSSWLYEINNYRVPECNWVFFKIFVNTALKCLNQKYDEKVLKESKDFIESNYLGDGWYKDGKTGRVDYYSSFAMSFYSLLLSKLTGENFEREKERASLFLKDFILFFDKEGAAIPYGRSLTYRFAEVAFISSVIFAEVDSVPLGVLKGIINRNLRYFLEKDIFTNDGILEVGYGYANSIMGEKYNGPGSPYWALKSFLILALDDANPYWSIKEEKLPIKEETKLIKKANMIIQNRNFDSSLYTPGHYEMNNLGHFQEKYFKFVYSSAFPFCCLNSQDSLEALAPDSTLAIKGFGDFVLTKYKAQYYEVKENEIFIKWSPIVGLTVFSTIVLTEDGHIRREKIESSYPISLEAYETAFSLESGDVEEKESFLSVKNNKYEVSIESIKGEGTPYLIKAFPNTNILYKNTVIPSLCFKVKQGVTEFETRIRTKESE